MPVRVRTSIGDTVSGRRTVTARWHLPPERSDHVLIPIVMVYSGRPNMPLVRIYGHETLLRSRHCPYKIHLWDVVQHIIDIFIFSCEVSERYLIKLWGFGNLLKLSGSVKLQLPKGGIVSFIVVCTYIIVYYWCAIIHH